MTSKFSTEFHPVVMCGGAGTRLWPLSREAMPKQFLNLFGEQSLLQMTVVRTAGVSGARPPLVICNAMHLDTVRNQLDAVGQPPQSVVLEPVGRNTAPAAALAALAVQAAAGRDDAVLLLLPADHLIPDVDAYGRAAQLAVQAAADGAVVTFGIVANAPETGYGYVKAASTDGAAPWPVDRFVEKPDQPTAESYLAAGGYFWNSGMFGVRADVLLAELAQFRPDIEAAVRAAWEAREVDANGAVRLDAGLFGAVPAESVDYAVMEHTTRTVLVPLDAGWNDVGSWSAVWSESPQDTSGNALVGDVVALDTSGCYVRSDGRTVALLGVDDLVVVDTGDALLIAARDRVQDVKELAAQAVARAGLSADGKTVT